MVGVILLLCIVYVRLSISESGSISAAPRQILAHKTTSTPRNGPYLLILQNPKLTARILIVSSRKNLSSDMLLFHA